MIFESIFLLNKNLYDFKKNIPKKTIDIYYF